MEVRISFKHMERSEALAEKAQEKISRLVEKYLHHPTDCHVTLAVEHQQHIIDCHITASGGVKVHARGEAEHMLPALDALEDKLHALLKKQKERNKSGNNHSSIKTQPYEAILDQDYMEADEVAKLDEIRAVNLERLR